MHTVFAETCSFRHFSYVGKYERKCKFCTLVSLIFIYLLDRKHVRRVHPVHTIGSDSVQECKSSAVRLKSGQQCHGALHHIHTQTCINQYLFK